MHRACVLSWSLPTAGRVVSVGGGGGGGQQATLPISVSIASAAAAPSWFGTTGKGEGVELAEIRGGSVEKKSTSSSCLLAGRVVAVGGGGRQGPFKVSTAAAASSSFGITRKGEGKGVEFAGNRGELVEKQITSSSCSPAGGRVVAVGGGGGGQQGPLRISTGQEEGEGVELAEKRGAAVEEKTTMPPDRKREEGRLQALRTSMALGERTGSVGQQLGTGRPRVVLLDVMGTIVRDPFHVDMPAFFGLTFKELLACKHPTAWIEFEKGLLTEEEFAVKMFNDRRGYDYEGLKQCMANGYEYLEGMEALLQRLKAAGIDMHIFSNYPIWYNMIEEKLNLSGYLPWTFVSCHTGLRKPSQEAFLDAAEWLGVHPSDCVFIDDQPRNIEAASNVGMTGIQFQNSQGLEKELALCGISLEPLMRSQKIS